MKIMKNARTHHFSHLIQMDRLVGMHHSQLNSLEHLAFFVGQGVPCNSVEVDNVICTGVMCKASM
jgi:hypothetical protein